jgi:peptide deformylase
VAVRPIRVLGDPVLRQKAKRVPAVDGSIRRLIQDMIDSMRAASGVGLAAPQIGVSLRVIVIGLPEEEPFALINPKIVKRSGERKVEEGCLSVPGYRTENLTRSVTVVAKGLDPSGRQRRVKGQNDLLAEALEHEIDHINGVLYIDRLESKEDLIKIEPAEPSGGGESRRTG